MHIDKGYKQLNGWGFFSSPTESYENKYVIEACGNSFSQCFKYF
jgi:hypothetical protein